jgi:hypothetical protein
VSAQVVAWVFANAPKDLRPTETLVALVLAEHANAESGLAYPSIARIADMARISGRAATAALKTLVEKGIIMVAFEATNKRPTVYGFPAFRDEIPAPQESKPRGEKTVSVGVQSVQRGGENPAPKLDGRERVHENVTPPSPSESPPKGTRAKAKHPIPDDWELTDDLRRYAIDNGIPASQVDHVAAEFKHYWLGDGRGKCNWSQAFQGRVREKAQYYQLRQERNDINANILHIGDYQQKRTPEEQAKYDEDRRRAAEKDRERRGGLTREEAWLKQQQELAQRAVPR